MKATQLMKMHPEYPWTTQAHNVFKWILLAQVAISILIGVIFGDLLMAVVIALVIVSVPIFLGINMPHHPISRHAVGIATQLMAALHIQQTFGMTEMHFAIFVLLAFLFFFRDWKVVVSSVVVVAVHHIGFFALQYYQIGSFVAFEEGRVMFSILIIHAVFAVAEGVVLGFMARKSHNEAVGAELLKTTVRNIMGKDGLIDLDEKHLTDVEVFPYSGDGEHLYPRYVRIVVASFF